jgi:hypothetical protein
VFLHKGTYLPATKSPDSYKVSSVRTRVRPHSNMIIEDQRVAHEDIERLENAIADRYRDEPKNVSNFLFLYITKNLISRRPLRG